LATVIIYLGLLWLNISSISQNIDIFYANLFYVFVFYFALIFSLSKRIYKRFHLLAFLLVINIFFIILYNYLYFNHTNLLFSFHLSDAYMYHNLSLTAAKQPFFNSISHFLSTTRHDLDDVGMVAYLSLIYRVVPAPFVDRFVNLILNIVTTLLLFKMARHYMKRNTAFLVALIFGIS